MTHAHIYQTSVWNKGRERCERQEKKESGEVREKTAEGKDKREKIKLMNVRHVKLTFSILQQKENCVFRDNELPQLHHVGHRMRHDGPLSLTTVAAPSQTLQ